MTPKGEHLTLKGEITDHLFQLKREVSITYSENTISFTALNKSLKSLQQSLRMVFILKGKLSCVLPDLKKPLLVLEDQQHNILLDHDQLILLCEQETHDMVFINIDYSLLTRYLPQDHTGLLNLKRGVARDEATVFSNCNLHITPEIIAILNSIKSSTHTGFCEKLFLESKVLELLVLQLSQFEQIKDDGIKHLLKKDDLYKMYEVREILTANMQEQFPLRTLSHMVGTNEFNLKRNFKIAFGTTVYGYLNEYKMEQARSMLINKDISIAELATKMGYKYATHFSSAFKKHFGYLPNKLRSGKFSLIIFMEDIFVAFENVWMILG
ncbi:AraC-like DNA-binding protein [Pedobacter sp. CAN_A7]|uniref:helix-turn-helix domain-containing protein n=1 Tax=Pedobacter sp. CAN_A7 TaxID=2787722 RepID=UPI0018C8D99A